MEHPSTQANIWLQMAYTAPRGACSQKTSMLTSCSCYRFMIHPLKAATSFDCDGCGHHASFHKMQNEQEEEIARRWKLEQMEQSCSASIENMAMEHPQRFDFGADVSAKRRKRIAGSAAPTIEGNHLTSNELNLDLDMEEHRESAKVVELFEAGGMGGGSGDTRGRNAASINGRKRRGKP